MEAEDDGDQMRGRGYDNLCGDEGEAHRSRAPLPGQGSNHASPANEPGVFRQTGRHARLPSASRAGEFPPGVRRGGSRGVSLGGEALPGTASSLGARLAVGSIR